VSFQIPERFQNTRLFNVAEFYSAFVPFTVNSTYPVHRWYRFKEGYSKDLVHLMLGSIGTNIAECLDPFGATGTTALACQEVGIRCHSIEVNPFLHHIAKVKLNNKYTLKGFDAALLTLEKNLKQALQRSYDVPVMSTITQRPNLDKWLFSPPVIQAILALRWCFGELNQLYADLFLVILGSILTDVGNTTKDGKCVRYKNGWRDLSLTRKQVCSRFFGRAAIFREDISHVMLTKKGVYLSNAELCIRGNALEEISRIRTSSVDAVITSPPYLNSFDYTDVYMPELWALGFVNDYEEVRELRAKTLCSHVQVKWHHDEAAFASEMKLLLTSLTGRDGRLWNGLIPKMIGGYFQDMRRLLTELRRVLKPEGRLCIVVGTSSYNKVTIPTDWLIAGIAEDVGFRLDEIKVVREFRRSTQQSGKQHRSLPRLRESVLTLRPLDPPR
jgi:DNA modification methylase